MRTNLYTFMISIFMGIQAFGASTYSRHYDVILNDTLEVQLSECVACGYSWNWINQDEVTHGALVYNKFVSHIEPGTLGGQGVRYMGFKGLSAGMDTIKLVYGPIWDPSQYDTLVAIINVVKSQHISSTITIGLNDTFQVELGSNPSTGYAWYWIHKQPNSIVDSIGHQYISNNPGVLGGGGKDIWEFKGVKFGSEMITLRYYQPSNPEPDVIETKTILVKVTDSSPATQVSRPTMAQGVVYPNPTKGVVNLEIQGGSGAYLLELFDLNGAKVLSKWTRSTKEELNLEGFKPGCYLLTLSQHNQVVVRKVVLKQ